MAQDHEKSYIIISHKMFVLYWNKPLGLVHKGSQFPSPNMEAKSQRLSLKKSLGLDLYSLT